MKIGVVVGCCSFSAFILFIMVRIGLGSYYVVNKNNTSTCCVLFPFVLCGSFSWSFLFAKCFLNYDSEAPIIGKKCLSIANNCQIINLSLDNG